MSVPERQTHSGLVWSGWILAGAALLVPLLAIGAVIIGTVLCSKDRTGAGVGQIVAGLLLGAISFLAWSGTYA